MPSLTVSAASRLASSRSRRASRASRSANTTLACSCRAACSRRIRSSASCSDLTRCSMALRSPPEPASRSASRAASGSTSLPSISASLIVCPLPLEVCRAPDCAAGRSRPDGTDGPHQVHIGRFRRLLERGMDELPETPGLGIPNHATGGHTEGATRGSCDAFVGRRRALARQIRPWPAFSRPAGARLQRPSDSWQLVGPRPARRDAPATARASSSGPKPAGRLGIGGVE